VPVTASRQEVEPGTGVRDFSATGQVASIKPSVISTKTLSVLHFSSSPADELNTMRHGFLPLAVAVVVFAMLPSAQAALTGSVAGTVTLTSARGSLSTVSVYGRRGVAPKPAGVGPETRKVVIQIAGARPSAAVPPMHARITQRGEQFTPAVTVVTVGSTVEFPNDDPYFHNVFSLSRANTFDLGRYPSGSSRSLVFERTGMVKVFCHLHAQMNALVVVLDHPWFTIPSENGDFALPPVPPGDYTLVAWHERIGERREPIRVAAGASTRVDFTLPVLETER
jgi:plastocyanin